MIKQYDHPDAVFGVAWSPANENNFVTGCRDGMVRLYDICSGDQNCIKIFKGHTDRVYNVIFNPNLPNIIVSGSDDRSVRVWDVN